jgi:asparagine synthase (glutamine-hydrolysing)
MCGIAGFIDFTKKAGATQLRQMTDCLSYRGPDASGYEFIEHADCHIGLGHRRLSIIDLSPLGQQPMWTEDMTTVIIFNGEVYNYAEIREELRAAGHHFISGSDTEVMLKGYLQWGSACVQKFTGMFAFVILDKKKNIVFICRDRAGVKPLYYYWYQNVLLFASELKSFFQFPFFHKEIDTTSVFNFLQYSYVPAPNCIFKHTYKLEPGHYMVMDLGTKKFENTSYWSVLNYYKKPKLDITEEDAQEELETRLKKASDYRMVSDVPVGLFLSGGYDSSLVAAMLQTNRTEKIKTFTIGFPEKKYDEAVYAKQVAVHLGTDHHEMYCTYDEAKSIIPELPYYYDEPFGDSSAIPTILVSRFARQKVTVALSADGGDEIFAGYERHAALLNLAIKVNSIPLAMRRPLSFLIKHAPAFVMKKLTGGKNISTSNIDKYLSFIKSQSDLVDMVDYANQVVMPDYLRLFVTIPDIAGREFFQKNEIRCIGDKLDQLLAFDYLSYLPNDILTKVDRATMSVSLEGREPLLDQNIIEWVASLPAHFKYRNGTSKYLLRKIVHKYIPATIMHRPKMGFAIPLIDWFRKDLRYLLDEHFSKKAIEQHGFFNYNRLSQELQEYYKGNDFSFSFLWNVLVFQLWYKRWMT